MAVSQELIRDITRRVLALVERSPEAAVRGPCAARAPGKDVSEELCSTCGGCATKRAEDVRALREMGLDRIAQIAGNDAPAADIAPLVDHTLLKPDATKQELLAAAAEAKKHGFASVCVSSANVRLVAAELKGSAVNAIALVGFPLGAGTPQAKAFEARQAIRNGASEIDMVIDVGALKAKDYAAVLDDLCTVIKACADVPVKVVIEAGAFSREEKIIACALAKIAGAAFVKTATGFGAGGTSTEDIALMRQVVGSQAGVDAPGALRLGAPGSVAIVSARSAARD